MFSFSEARVPVGSTVPPPPNSPVASGFTGAKYVTFAAGGANGVGGIVQVSYVDGQPTAQQLIFSFPGGAGGEGVAARAVFGPDGNLYGTTEQGGTQDPALCQPSGGCGIVYRLTPADDGTWSETVLYTFQGGVDGSLPVSDLVFDASGNLYGTTVLGGDFSSPDAKNCTGFEFNTVFGCGVVFMLSPSASPPWTETVLYAFSGGADGAQPKTGLTFDKKGKLYGTTFAGGALAAPKCTSQAQEGQTPGCGTVFRLTPGSSAPWKETVLYAFKGGKDGAEPLSDLTIAGTTIAGTTVAGGNTRAVVCTSQLGIGFAAGCGTVFTLTPPY